MGLTLTAAGIVGQLRRRFGIRGSTDLTLEESIIPIANLGDLDLAPWNVKRGGIGHAAIGPIAAQFSYIWLRLPLLSGVNVVIRKIILHAGAATNVNIAVIPRVIIDALGGAGGKGTTWDSDDNTDKTALGQLPGSSAEVMAVTSVTDLLVGATWIRLNIAASPSVQLDLPFSIRQNNALVIQCLTLNTQLTASFFWDEYPLE